MIDALLVVLTKPVAGREADFDDWYTNIHIRDALRFRGSLAAQRFRRSAAQVQDLPSAFDWTHLALYDVFDPERFGREHLENALTTRMMVSDAIDDGELWDYHYYPLAFRDNDPAELHTGGVIVEQIQPLAGRETAFRDWYEANYLPAMTKRAGVKSGALLTYRSFGQMIPSRPDHDFVAVYRINQAAAAEAWRDTRLRDWALVDTGSLIVSLWEPITPRITKDAVQHPNAAALAEEERARTHMGKRVKTGGAEKLATT